MNRLSNFDKLELLPLGHILLGSISPLAAFAASLFSFSFLFFSASLAAFRAASPPFLEAHPPPRFYRYWLVVACMYRKPH
jgi:hypothetical protein